MNVNVTVQTNKAKLRRKGGAELYAIVDGEGRPVIMCLTEGQISDHIGAKILYLAMPEGAAVLIGGYHAMYPATLKPEITRYILQSPL